MNNFRANQAASAYRKIATVVPPDMAVVRLYDAVIVLIQRTINAIEHRRRDEGFVHVHRAASILRGLSHILDFERGGALAAQLQRMYSSNILALYGALGKPDASMRYRKLAEGLAEMRDAWATVAGLRTRAQEAAPKPSPR